MCSHDPSLDEPVDSARRQRLTELGALRGARIKLRVFAGLTLVAALVDMPVWSQLALLTTTMMIPLAVAVQAGPRLVRVLVLPGAAAEPQPGPGPGPDEMTPQVLR